MRRRSASALARNAAAIAFSAPEVVAHRLARIAQAGPAPGRRDRRETTRMAVEKVEAFWEAWSAMALQALRIQQQMWAASLAFPWQARAFDPARQFTMWQSAVTRIVARGLVPVRRRTTANAKRLRRAHARRRRGTR